MPTGNPWNPDEEEKSGNLLEDELENVNSCNYKSKPRYVIQQNEQTQNWASILQSFKGIQRGQRDSDINSDKVTNAAFFSF